MKDRLVKTKNLILILVLTALAIAMGCVFAACSRAQAESVDASSLRGASPEAATKDPASVPATGISAEDNYSRWLSDHYSAGVYTHEMWLTDLIHRTYPSAQVGSAPQAIFDAAYRRGVIDSADEQHYSPLTRRYVARTLVRALGYQPRNASAADLGKDDGDMKTLVYYGYFLPDEDDKVYPDAAITVKEYNALLGELDRRNSLKGKKLLAFGDSIMFGRGNRDSGVADMLAEKYGMISLDHSVSGATLGARAGRNSIPTQIKRAASLSPEPDIILINGGTNDMEFIPLGKAAKGYEEETFDQTTYAGGFEYAASLLRLYWQDVPVIYIRAHDMDTVDDAKEQQYGELALSLSEKWRLYCVDVYNDADLNTEDPAIRDAYTVYKPRLGHGDGIHPTALGYAKFYLPLVTNEITAIFE